MKLSDLSPHLLHQFGSEAELVRSIDEISHAFTRERDKLALYLNDPRLVSAYTLFYLSTNIPKLRAVLTWMPVALRMEMLACELIDIGAGPGTFTLAWHALGGEKSIMLESSRLMREQATRLLAGLHHKESRFDVPAKTQKRLALFGHSLNEMGLATGLRYVRDCEADYALLIEPGTKDVFKLALQFRQQLLAAGWQIVFPCLGQGSCPMEHSSDWCHQYVDVRHEVDVERLTQLAHKDRRRQPLTVMLFQRSGEVRAEGKDRARLVRVKDETKFSFAWQVCRSEDDRLRLSDFQLMKKQFSKSEAKRVALLLSGALIEFETEKELAEATRIRLKTRPDTE